jgi:hypothetical protein
VLLFFLPIFLLIFEVYHKTPTDRFLKEDNIFFVANLFFKVQNKALLQFDGIFELLERESELFFRFLLRRRRLYITYTLHD